MSVAAEELRDLAKTMESERESDRAIIRLLCAIAGFDDTVGSTGAPAVAISNGTNTTSPAGARSVSFKILTGPSVIAGRTFDALDTFSPVAPQGTRLPAILPVGGTWDWIAFT